MLLATIRHVLPQVSRPFYGLHSLSAHCQVSLDHLSAAGSGLDQEGNYRPAWSKEPELFAMPPIRVVVHLGVAGLAPLH